MGGIARHHSARPEIPLTYGKAELRIEIDEHLLQQARAAEIQIALTVENALKNALGNAAAEERAQKWAHDNAGAIAAHNRYVDEHGAFGSEWRRW